MVKHLGKHFTSLFLSYYLLTINMYMSVLKNLFLPNMFHASTTSLDRWLKVDTKKAEQCHHDTTHELPYFL